MKKRWILLVLILTSLSIYGQEIVGKWNGLLKIQGAELRLIFNIEKSGKTYVSTMDSPDQGAKGLPVKKTTYKNSILKIEMPDFGIKYEGKMTHNGIIDGIFKQAGLEIPLKLSKKEVVIKRPQEPIKPYPYYCEEITFKNKKANIKLAGTLTLPKKKGKFPAVILISGSGAQNRNEELANHKPFLVLSDYLTKKGIAVLRFDDRGVAESTGSFNTATTFNFASDVESAIKYLKTRKEIDKNKIGLIGHSEGGTIACIIASRNKDVDFIVSMAGSMLRGDKLLLLQKSKIEKEMGINQTAINQRQVILKKAYKMILDKKLSQAVLKNKLYTYFKAQYDKRMGEALTKQLSSIWMITFVRLDPTKYISKINCPMLALNGKKDLQVPTTENLNALKANFKNKKKLTIKEFDNLNHLFQECTTGLPTEYGTIKQTISPKVLDCIASWILKQTE